MLDLAAITEGLFESVKGYVERAVAPLHVEIAELKAEIAMLQKRPDVAEVRAMIGEVGPELFAPAAGKDGRDGIDGKDAEPITDEQLAAAVAAHLAAHPPAVGKDGADGKDGRDGKDGVGAASALIDRSGNLVLTLTDGRTIELGAVVGKDGENGSDGQDGRNGEAGLGFDDLEFDYDGERAFAFRLIRGDVVKEYSFTAPLVIDRGVFKAETAYAKGDGVSFGGSFFIAQRDTSERPETSDAWRLAVKRGRDGKDGVVKSAKVDGPLKVAGAASGKDD
jgi:hypothetical protein